MVIGHLKYSSYLFASVKNITCLNSKYAVVSKLLTRPSEAYCGLCNVNQKRNYAFPSKLPFKYVREEKPSFLTKEGSDDLDNFPDLDLNQPKIAFKESKELETADENVKKIFSLEFGRPQDRKEKAFDLLLKEIELNPCDSNTIEFKVAKLTCNIRNLRRHLEIKPKTPKARIILSESIHKRRKWLKRLRAVDYDRFVWLLEKLNIVYTPHFDDKVPSRKDTLRRMTDEYCEKMKHDRLLEYAKTLKTEQKEFLKKKEETLKWIESEKKKFDIKGDDL